MDHPARRLRATAPTTSRRYQAGKAKPRLFLAPCRYAFRAYLVGKVEHTPVRGCLRQIFPAPLAGKAKIALFPSAPRHLILSNPHSLHRSWAHLASLSQLDREWRTGKAPGKRRERERGYSGDTCAWFVGVTLPPIGVIPPGPSGIAGTGSAWPHELALPASPPRSTAWLGRPHVGWRMPSA